MAFAPYPARDAPPASRTVALLAVALLHAGIGAGLLLARGGDILRRAAVEPPAITFVDVARPAPSGEAPAEPARAPRQMTPLPVSPARPADVEENASPVPAGAAAEESSVTSAVPAATPALPVPAVAPAPVPAPPPAPAAERADVAESYRQRLWQHVAARRPQGLHLEGETVVAFTLDRAGRLLSLDIERSSGNRLLDRLALRTLRAAAPLPAPPAELPDNALRFSLAFSFR